MSPLLLIRAFMPHRLAGASQRMPVAGSCAAAESAINCAAGAARCIPQHGFVCSPALTRVICVQASVWSSCARRAISGSRSRSGSGSSGGCPACRRDTFDPSGLDRAPAPAQRGDQSLIMSCQRTCGAELRAAPCRSADKHGLRPARSPACQRSSPTRKCGGLGCSSAI